MTLYLTLQVILRFFFFLTYRYVKDLEDCITYYMSAMDNCPDAIRGLDDVIFGNWKELHKFHRYYSYGYHDTYYSHCLGGRVLLVTNPDVLRRVKVQNAAHKNVALIS